MKIYRIYSDSSLRIYNYVLINTRKDGTYYTVHLIVDKIFGRPLDLAYHSKQLVT